MANLKKNAKGYGYNYTDLAEIHRYLDDNNLSYYQFIRRIEGDDYVMTRRCIDGEWEAEALQGSRVAQATLQGIKNPAQEQGSALTYARRYSLLMAFGLSTEDDDGKACEVKQTKIKMATSSEQEKIKEMCVKENVDIFKVLSKLKIQSIEELTKKQFENVTENWANVKETCKK